MLLVCSVATIEGDESAAVVVVTTSNMETSLVSLSSGGTAIQASETRLCCGYDDHVPRS